MDRIMMNVGMYRDSGCKEADRQDIEVVSQFKPQEVVELEVSTAGILEDIDLPEDYQRALGRLSDGHDD